MTGVRSFQDVLLTSRILRLTDWELLVVGLRRSKLTSFNSKSRRASGFGFARNEIRSKGRKQISTLAPRQRTDRSRRALYEEASAGSTTRRLIPSYCHQLSRL